MALQVLDSIGPDTHAKVERWLGWSVVRQVIAGVTGVLGALGLTHILEPEDVGAFDITVLIYFIVHNR